MRVTALLIATLFVAVGCDRPQEPTSGADRSYVGAFVTKLGADTVAVEEFQRTPEDMTAEVVMRSPRTTVSSYDLKFDSTGDIARYSVEERDPTNDSLFRTALYLPEGDSMRVEATADGQTTARRIAREPGMLPFIDMVHWPFDMMLTRLYEAEADSAVQVLFTDQGTMDFVVKQGENGAMTVRHPYRGTMDVQVDDRGRLVHLDAGRTTRALTVDRRSEVDLANIAARFVAKDEAGAAFGPLSGRGQTRATVDGATLALDYGQPEKRGREIFGGLVPWGELWRTGANRATHFETDQDIVLGSLDVPAGRYTLYTVPEPDGGTLIVNTQTGQGGTTYDRDLDLGRVEMARTDRSDTVEALRFEIEDTDEGGALKLLWDRSEFVVPFTVRETG